jgi:transketolase
MKIPSLISTIKEGDLQERARAARKDILTMTTVAGSGHPGGSMSTIDLLLSTLERSNLRPDNHTNFYRDHIVVSHGHVSPAVYAALVQYGFIEQNTVLGTYRLAGSLYQGHIERYLPGVDWTTGNLGQGLAAACGIALALKKGGDEIHTVYAICSDGEHAKGQIAEARHFAVHHGLDNLVVLIDFNGLQISGSVHDVMRVNIVEEYLAAGWNMQEIDGHDLSAIQEALETASSISGVPKCIVGKTILGKGVSFMENKPSFHGKALSEVEYIQALEELGYESELDIVKQHRATQIKGFPKRPLLHTQLAIDGGVRRVYPPDVMTDMRSGWGQALFDIGELNQNILVFDCDLSESVKTKAFAEAFPDRFVQAGVQEHATATIAGAASISDQLVFWADYGAFAVDEVYNQQRLNFINDANLKTVCTHCGIDVGEDGPTHQVVDTIGLLRNLPATRVLLPADPNQADALTRYMATTAGNMFMLMGRSKVPVILDKEGHPFYGETYVFKPGEWDWLREGDAGLIAAWGTMTSRALAAADEAKKYGIEVGVVSIPSLDQPSPNTLTKLRQVPWVITVEDHWAETGIGGWLSFLCMKHHITPRVTNLGATELPFSGSANDVYSLMGLNHQGILACIKEMAESINDQHVQQMQVSNP